MPAVSVLMSVRNGESFLRPAIETLLAQSLRDFELVVVDDGSTDATPSLLAEYAARDPRLRTFRTASGQGLAAALNFGLAECRAPLVARADADDEYHPERLARQALALHARPELGVISCGFDRIDATGVTLGRLDPVVGSAHIRFGMLFTNALLHSGAMFRAELVRRAGGYDPAFWTAQDTDLWARLLPLCELDNLTDTLVRYRVHASSVMKKRGPEGLALSRSVPARLLSAYLGRPVGVADATPAIMLYQALEPCTGPQALAGEALLCEVLHAARGREPPPVLARYRQRTAWVLTGQARRLEREAPTAARRLYARALAWRPNRRAVLGTVRTFGRLRSPGTQPNYT